MKKIERNFHFNGNNYHIFLSKEKEKDSIILNCKNLLPEYDEYYEILKKDCFCNISQMNLYKNVTENDNSTIFDNLNKFETVNLYSNDRNNSIEAKKYFNNSIKLDKIVENHIISVDDNKSYDNGMDLPAVLKKIGIEDSYIFSANAGTYHLNLKYIDNFVDSLILSNIFPFYFKEDYHTPRMKDFFETRVLNNYSYFNRDLYYAFFSKDYSKINEKLKILNKSEEEIKNFVIRNVSNRIELFHFPLFIDKGFISFYVSTNYEIKTQQKSYIDVETTVVFIEYNEENLKKIIDYIL